MKKTIIVFSILLFAASCTNKKKDNGLWMLALAMGSPSTIVEEEPALTSNTTNQAEDVIVFVGDNTSETVPVNNEDTVAGVPAVNNDDAISNEDSEVPSVNNEEVVVTAEQVEDVVELSEDNSALIVISEDGNSYEIEIDEAVEDDEEVVITINDLGEKSCFIKPKKPKKNGKPRKEKKCKVKKFKKNK